MLTAKEVWNQETVKAIHDAIGEIRNRVMAVGGRRIGDFEAKKVRGRADWFEVYSCPGGGLYLLHVYAKTMRVRVEIAGEQHGTRSMVVPEHFQLYRQATGSVKIADILESIR